MHRATSPTATLSPHLGSLITHQLQQRLVQEAELLHARTRSAGEAWDSSLARASIGAGYERGAGGAAFASVALIDVAPQDTARLWTPSAVATPQYALEHLVPDTGLRADLRAWMQRTPRAWTAAGDGAALVRHPATTPLAIALWRLATWIDSQSRLLAPID